MKSDIILSGVGGQGILSIAATIGTAALSLGMNMKQSEVHGMSQRGGAVVSHMRISDKAIASDLIPKHKADMIISVEPMESLRYLNYLKPEGFLISNSKPYKNIAEYPDLEEIYAEIRKIKNHVLLDADTVAKELKSPKSSNIVMLGAALPYIGIGDDVFEKALHTIFGSKGEEIVNKNIAALKAGQKISKEQA